AARLSATVDAASIETDYPDSETVDFNGMLRGPEWLDAEANPHMTFSAMSIEMTGADTAKITGDFTLRGVTRPLVLDAKFNGGYKGFAPYDPQARIGFSARGKLKRSDYGLVIGLPTPEFPIGVGDNVEIIIETELLGPPLEE
ncbi:MAG: YceI family protein, partial [Amphiplicatus sp.]